MGLRPSSRVKREYLYGRTVAAFQRVDAKRIARSVAERGYLALDTEWETRPLTASEWRRAESMRSRPLSVWIKEWKAESKKEEARRRLRERAEESQKPVLPEDLKLEPQSTLSLQTSSGSLDGALEDAIAWLEAEGENPADWLLDVRPTNRGRWFKITGRRKTRWT